MNTIITIDLSKEIIPANIVAAIHGESETTKQKNERLDREKADRAKEWEKETLVAINTQLIEKGIAFVKVPVMSNYHRADIVKICDKLWKAYEKKGFVVGGYGEYSPSNPNYWYSFVVQA